MQILNIDKEWEFNEGLYDIYGALRPSEKRIINLPHDAMIEQDTDRNSKGGTETAFFNCGVVNYNKKLIIPAEWGGEKVYLKFDGAMMNTTVEVNGSKAGLHHYGYAPFVVDITKYIYFGEENRICITCNGSSQPNSRWYTGLGIYRSLNLLHGPKLHIANDGIYAFTKSVKKNPDGFSTAVVGIEVEIENETDIDKLAFVEAFLCEKSNDNGKNSRELLSDTTMECNEKAKNAILSRKTKLQINSNQKNTAYITMTVENPKLWDASEPNLYDVVIKMTESGDFITHEVKATDPMTDIASVQFGIRTVTADVKNGLCINGKTVKLKGGCLHHDNGILGAVSMYDVEYRKISHMKSIGYNAVRTTHNPPSKALLDACDRLGMYVLDEAFDAWDIGKVAGDYNQYFEADWKNDLTLFMKRDRSRACVIMWSDGNEIPERGGIGKGYARATEILQFARSLDTTRPITNGVCSFWSGLDDQRMISTLMKMGAKFADDVQNKDVKDSEDIDWEEWTEPFVNGLDIVGYNYMESRYDIDHEMYPERIILGSENYPKEIGIHWPMIEKTPYVIGDFTWTAYDYIGEAGIGKSAYMEPGDPRLKMGPYALSSHTSTYPWRTANDADFDITGMLRPQGAYRSVVWGSDKTYLYSYNPNTHGKIEVLSTWGFADVSRCWNWPDANGKTVDILVFTGGDEVELLLNGKSLGRKTVDGVTRSQEMPGAVAFEITYEEGTLEAVGYKNGKELSRDSILTVGAPSKLNLIRVDSDICESDQKTECILIEVLDQNNNPIPNAVIELTAEVTGQATLAGFGSGAPITEDNYTKGICHTFDGKAMAILRDLAAGGESQLTVKAAFAEASLKL